MSIGKLYLVGIGPGDRNLLTPAASETLRACDVIVGYKGYIDQVADLIEGKDVVSMGLGDEMERAKKAVDLAKSGHDVAVISSGDVGIYAMAGPVYQVIVDENLSDDDLMIETVPGISAMQSAASVLGSPLMQDFCTISLSNLMTPWETIRKRVDAAAIGDFVISLYNPKSMRRTWQLGEVRDLILAHRTADTPVGIVRNASRIDQTATLTTLGDLPDHYDVIDMFTVLVIGNSTSYQYMGKMVTPRGYERKPNAIPESV